MKYQNRYIFSLTTSCLILLSGCNLYKPYELPADNKYIEQYQKAIEEAADTTSLPYLSWSEVFTDPILQNYIAKAIDNNKDLENARKNIDIARAQLKGARLSYFPSATFTPNGGSASYGGSHMNWSYTLPVALNWEIDAFGKILNRKRGAEASVEQTQAYRQAAQSQIICGVANTYYAIVLLNNQLDLSKRTAEIWKDQVEAMQLMKNAGMVTEAAVVQSQAQYYSILASIPDIETQIHTTQNTLALLLNEYPDHIYEVSKTFDLSLPSDISESIPLTYLAVRPDVKAAERSLAMAYYQTNSARAAFYPSIAISSQGGFTNLLGGLIKNPGEWFIQLAGQLTAPLFSRGQNIASLEAAKASQEIALNNFQYSILNASAEVSDALIKYTNYKEKSIYIAQQVDAFEKSVEYTQELLSLNQSTTYLEVLTAQSGLLNAQLASLACEHNRVSAMISLYQALGGGR